MKKRFASFLLTGKAATMPIFMGSSQADVTPSYYEITSTNVNIMEMPETGAVRLLTTTAPAASSYGSIGSSALLCNTAPSSPSTLNVVVTGLKHGDTVYLAASTSKDSPGLLALNPNMRIGMDNLVSTSGAVFNSAPAQLGFTINTQNGTGTMMVPIDLATLQARSYAFTEGGKFYLQAVAVPAGGSWDVARCSELDEVVVSSAACSSYGPYGAY